MGILFLEHPNAGRYYVCVSCEVYLTNKNDLISSRFTSRSGPALLFHQVFNVDYSEPDFRNLTTGGHYVRDVFCKGCATKLGWFYEYTTRQGQAYKEGKTILEEALIWEKTSDFME